MMTVRKKRCVRAVVAKSGPITATLYQMLNALPSSCGTTGARPTRSSPETFRGSHAGFTLAGGSMAESNQTKSTPQQAHLARIHAADPGSLRTRRARLPRRLVEANGVDGLDARHP